MKIGLFVYLAYDREGNVRSYESIRTITRQAEADGFDSIWVADHLFYRTADEPTRGIWEAWTVLSALAEATERVEIGPLVLCNSFRNPAIVAKMAATIDEVSNGRLILGFGAGWNEPEYKAFGIPFDHRVDRFEEALQILKPLLREGHVDFEGKYYQAPDCEIAPLGPRPAGPPLMIGAEGPRMLKLAAQYGDLWNIGYMGTPDTLAEPRAKFEAACHDVGRDPATIGVTVFIGLWFPDLQPEKPSMFPTPLTGSPDEIAQAMLGYRDIGVQHIMFQCAPYTPESLARLTQALEIYRTMDV
jgi:probable F420-dependent oxidoreductase